MRQEDKWKIMFVQLMRYLCVGGVAFLVDFGMLVVFRELFSINYLYAASMSFALGLLVNYGLCLKFVFSDRVLSNQRHEFLLFCVVGLLGLCLNAFLMWFLVSGLGYGYIGAKLVSALFVLVFNFVLRRQLLFNPISTLANRLQSWSHACVNRVSN